MVRRDGASRGTDDEGVIQRSQEAKVPPPPGYEYSIANIAKLTAYILALWAFCAGFYAALLFITTAMRHAPYRHLPAKFIGNFAYQNNDATDVAPTYLPQLMPWVKKIMCNSNNSSATCVPLSTSANSIGYPVTASCGALCTNS